MTQTDARIAQILAHHPLIVGDHRAVTDTIALTDHFLETEGTHRQTETHVSRTTDKADLTHHETDATILETDAMTLETDATHPETETTVDHDTDVTKMT